MASIQLIGVHHDNGAVNTHRHKYDGTGVRDKIREKGVQLAHEIRLDTYLEVGGVLDEDVCGAYDEHEKVNGGLVEQEFERGYLAHLFLAEYDQVEHVAHQADEYDQYEDDSFDFFYEDSRVRAQLDVGIRLIGHNAFEEPFRLERHDSFHFFV